MQRQEFDQFADNYKETLDISLESFEFESTYFAEQKIREIKKAYPQDTAGATFLDLGCGHGACTAFFRHYYPQAELHGYDISSESIAVAKQRSLTNAVFEAYDGQRIPQVSNSYDVVLVANVLHHIQGWEAISLFLQECFRVLKPGGKLFVFEHNPLNPVTRKIVRDCIFDRDATLIHNRDLRCSLRRIGFNVKTKYIIFFPGSLRALRWIEDFLGWLPLGGQYIALATKPDF